MMTSLAALELVLDVPFSQKNRKNIYLTLENGLRCLLVSDNSTDLISGAVVVDSGNFNDPPEVAGLAHLAEHIMMRGSEKNKSNDIDNLIISSGGSINAFTSAEKTCFYFEISTYAKNTLSKNLFVLESLLPVFASRLEKPQINEKTIRLEITAVENEHNGNRSDPEKLYLHALRLLANPIHPFSRFGCGNVSTLTSVPLNKLKRILASHISRYYRPRNMVLVLKGPQTLMHLRKLVMTNFSNLGNHSSAPSSPKNMSSNIFDNYNDIPLFNEKNCIIVKSPLSRGMRFFVSLKYIRSLRNYGPVLRLICNLIGDESSETLCDSLKRKLQWVNSVYVFIQEICQEEEILVIQINATTQGYKNTTQLREAVLFYIEKVIAAAPKNQIIQLARKFEHIERYTYLSLLSNSSAMEEVCTIAERIISGKFKESELIRGFSYWDDINSAYDELQSAIKLCFARDNWKIVILENDFQLRGLRSSTIRHDNIFDFDYILKMISFENKTKFDFKFIKMDTDIEKLAPIVSRGNLSRLTKIRDLETQWHEPKLLVFEDTFQVWHQQSKEGEGADYSVVSISIQFLHVPRTAKNLVILELLAEIIGQKLKPCLYHLELIGNEWGIYTNVNGTMSLLVNLAGTSEAIETQAKIIFNQIQIVLQNGGSYDYQEVKGPRRCLRERYNDFLDTSGVRRVIGASYMLLEERQPAPEERIEALEEIDSAEIESFLQNIRATKCQVSILASGSIRSDQCFDLLQCARIVESSEEQNLYLRERSSILLKKATNVFVMLGLAILAVMYYLQVGERTDKHEFVKAKVFEYIMALTAENDLRKKKGLVYGLLTGIRMFKRTFGLYIAVPSGAHKFDHIIEEIEDYFKKVITLLAGMSEHEFHDKILVPFMESLGNGDAENRVASGAFSALEPHIGSGKKPTSALFKKHWCNLEQILNGTLNFKARDCEEELCQSILRGITVKNMQEFTAKHISIDSSDRAALIICNEASELGAQQKLAAKVLASQLRQLGCTIPEEDMKEILSKCSDQKTYTDAIKSLEKYFSQTGEGANFMKFRVKFMVGATIRRTKQGLRRSKNAAYQHGWPTYTDYKEIQRRNSIAPGLPLIKRRERLHQRLIHQWEGEQIKEDYLCE